MKVREIMTSRPLTCSPQANLAEVAHAMWNGDCGIMPIVDAAGKLLGVVTDRDICIAAATRNQAPSSLTADELPRGDVFACRPDDDAQVAMTLMREHRIRRVPVTAADGTLVGILSVNDVILAAGSRLGATEVLDTMKGICGHRQPARAAAKAAGAAMPRP